MGHLGSTYEKYYTPTHIARDFQSIYFGSPSEDLLIQSVARMGLSRDRRAPTELDDEQQERVRNDPTLELDASRCENVMEVWSQQLFPTVAPHPICLICIGNEEFSYEKRMRHIPRKDVLKKHVETHFRLPGLRSEFQSRHPSCSEMLKGMKHFNRHALEVHKAAH